MKSRRTARRLALDVLYEAEIRDVLPNEAFERRRSEGWVVPAPDDQAPLDEADGVPAPAEEAPDADALSYALELVAGVQAHHADIDALIVAYADRWAIQRMPLVDRNLVRLAIFELMWGDDIPVAVAINEAVEVAKELSTDDSGRFVNGLLGRIAEAEPQT
ncbi:MAG: transcription antitermination factor NusB [Actinobacteria bacterium]|nr:transcription antitermination factor NusB [Actinomycetota bacterium]